MNAIAQTILDELDSSIRGISSEELRYATGPEKWTPAQVLEHLTLVYTFTTLGMTRCLEAGAPNPGTGTTKEWLGKHLLLTLDYFPKGRKSPERAKPRGADPDCAVQSALGCIPALDAASVTCAERFGWNTKLLRHPFIGPLSAREWLLFHRLHTRHHIAQIVNLRRLAKSVRTI